MKVPREALGISLLAFEGAFAPMFLVVSRALQAAGWPYYRFSGIVFFALGAAVVLFRACRGTLSRRFMVVKWVFLRGFFGAMGYVLLVIAAPLAPVGDIVALASINTVVASVVGMLFLHERLGVVQVLACGFSLSGATLISRPSFIFGGTAVSNAAVVGYVLALGGGAGNALSAISARRVPEAPVSELVASALVQIGMVLLIIPSTPICDDPSWGRMMAAPMQALAVALAVATHTFLSSVLYATGCQLVPAAVSSTVHSAAILVFGYVAQWLIFATAPGYLTVIGASLMFVSVVLVGVSRAPVPAAIVRSLSGMHLMSNPTTPANSAPVSPTNDGFPDLPRLDAVDDVAPADQADDAHYAPSSTALGTTADATETQHEDDAQSLISFVLSEFSSVAPRAEQLGIRKRATAAAGAEQPVPTMLGMTGIVMSTGV